MNGRAPSPATAAANARLVADPGHRPLGDGHAGAERPAHRGPGAQCSGRPVVAYGVLYGGGQGADRPARVAPALGEAGGEEAVLTDRQELGARVLRTEHPRHEQRIGRDARGVRPPAVQHPVPADHDGLRTVHGPQRRGRRLRKPRLGEQRQLAVQDHSGRPAGHGRRRRTGADAAAGPDREVDAGLGEQALEQDEGAELARSGRRSRCRGRSGRALRRGPRPEPAPGP